MYTFADGTTTEVEVPEEIGAIVLNRRREEENLARKERAHCYSLDALQYGDCDIYAPRTDFTPLDGLVLTEENEELYNDFHMLSKVQQRRLYKFSMGMSMREIAREEGVDHRAVRESIEAARKKFQKIYKNHSPK